MAAGYIWPKIYCIYAFEIDPSDYVIFYIFFYLFQAVSGVIFVVFYRWTEYNNKQNIAKFASVLAWMLWLPIVLIMIFFGTDKAATMIWGIAMVGVIYLDTFLYGKIMNQKDWKLLQSEI